VSPAIENDSRDVGFGIESRAREHVGELLSELALVFAERNRKQLRASEMGLLVGRLAGMRYKILSANTTGEAGRRAGQPSLAVLTSTVFFSRGDGLWGGDGI